MLAFIFVFIACITQISGLSAMTKRLTENLPLPLSLNFFKNPDNHPVISLEENVRKLTSDLSVSEVEDWKIELHQIDAEIKELEDQKNRYLAAARRHEDQGMQWQFQQNEKQEAKRAFQMADTKKQAAQMLQSRIDALKARRAQIVQEHPEANVS